MKRVPFILLSFILLSCQNNKTDDGFLTTKSKFKYKIISAETAEDSIKPNDVVKLHLTQFIDDSLMNDTRRTMPEYVKIDSLLRDFEYTEILEYMKVNDSAVCIFPITEILKRSSADIHLPHFLENREKIIVFVKIIKKFGNDSLATSDFLSEKRLFDSLIITKEKIGFIRANTVFDSLIKSVNEPLRSLPNGVFIQLLQKGSDERIQKGDSVAILYKGMLANGTFFDEATSKKPFLIRAGELETIEGFDSGIASLNYGDKAKIFIPAKLAYGSNPIGKVIPPFSNLVFEVTVNKH